MADGYKVNWERLKQCDRLTLMHMLMMVFQPMKPPWGKVKFQNHFVKDLLIEAISCQINTLPNTYISKLLWCEPYKLLKNDNYQDIYDALMNGRSSNEFYYLQEQNNKLRNLAPNSPEEDAEDLWKAMTKCREEHENKSYLKVFADQSKWLFKDHDDVLENFDVERTYKLLTVSIVISLNQKTSMTEEVSDPLDTLCKNFLFDGPPEKLPDFTLREIFNTLFPDNKAFAVKRAKDDEYAKVMRDDLKEKDLLCILLPWLDAQYDLHPSSKEDAKALLDNNQVDKNIADRLQRFFYYFSNCPEPIWKQFVAHLKESLTQCSRADNWKYKPKAIADELLKQELPFDEIPSYSDRYLDILCNNSQWNRIDCEGFWNGKQVDISLPTKCKIEKDAQQLYHYIAAYVLIALCCLKVDNSQTPKERKAFKEALIQKIHNPTSISVEKHEEIKQENEALKRIVAEEKRKNNEMTNMFRRLLKALLFLMHMSASVDFSEVIKGLIREVIPHCDYTQNEMAEIEAELEKPFRRFRGKDSPGWDNGGN